MTDERKEDVPWLGFIEPDLHGGMAVTRVPELAGLIIHESNGKETAPMGIVKITLKHIDLVCLCGKNDCNLKLRLRVEKTGHHPVRSDG